SPAEMSSSRRQTPSTTAPALLTRQTAPEWPDGLLHGARGSGTITEQSIRSGADEGKEGRTDVDESAGHRRSGRRGIGHPAGRPVRDEDPDPGPHPAGGPGQAERAAGAAHHLLYRRWGDGRPDDPPADRVPVADRPGVLRHLLLGGRRRRAE